NVRFSLATGRAYYSSIKRIEKELGIQGVHILHGGAMIFDSISNKILFLQAISDQSTKKMIQYFLTQKLAFSLEAKDHVYLSVIIKGDKHYADILNQPLSEYKNNEPILKMVLWAKANRLTEEEINLHIDNLQKNYSDISAIKFNFFNFFGADITSEKATKHTAVLEYLKILNLSPDEVVAIGDGLNDYPLFTACGFGIAMAAAPKELKEIAGLVVPKVTDGGMVEALEYIDKNLI
ncbi:MAG: HAD hydrolase family protein, partial [Candidatus Roizmanbacteria bacterium]|nr:HAD hydrolase family protein [Candidatus Roizmanbacteria bacterium]